MSRAMVANRLGSIGPTISKRLFVRGFVESFRWHSAFAARYEHSLPRCRLQRASCWLSNACPRLSPRTLPLMHWRGPRATVPTAAQEQTRGDISAQLFPVCQGYACECRSGFHLDALPPRTTQFERARQMVPDDDRRHGEV